MSVCCCLSLIVVIVLIVFFVVVWRPLSSVVGRLFVNVSCVACCVFLLSVVVCR